MLGGFPDLSRLEAASRRAGVYFASHLFNHYNCARLEPAELREYYARNDRELERFGNTVSMFSYPFGQPVSCFNESTDEVILSLGTKAIFTAFPRIERLRSMRRIHRVAPRADLQTEDAFLSWLNFVLLRQPLHAPIAS